MKLVYAGIAGFVALVVHSTAPGPGIDQTTVGSIPAAAAVHGEDRFELRSTRSEGACIVAVGGGAGEFRRPLRIEPACASLGTGLESATYWLEKPDGSVAFTDGAGTPVASFATGDGAAFESYSPADPVMVLLARD